MRRSRALTTTLVVAAALIIQPTVQASAGNLSATQTPAQQFDQITALVGSWNVAGRDSHKIIFEATAGNSVIVEKWMSGERLHSLTIYHLDGNKLIATHYCPQGNQPRMAAVASPKGLVKFTFQDATDLDPEESFQHDLSLAPQENGSLIRSEVYWGPGGAGEPSSLILTRQTG